MTTTDEQARLSHTDGLLAHPNHYDFKPERKSDYRQSAISADKFFDWTKDNMYKSSYNTSYCKVSPLGKFRAKWKRRMLRYPNTKATFPTCIPRISMLRATVRLPVRLLDIKSSERIHSNFRLRDITSIPERS